MTGLSISSLRLGALRPPLSDTIEGTDGPDSLTGTDGADILRGNAGSDTLDGLGGDDFLGGGFNHDLLLGGDGDDDLWGHTGDDTLVGGAGDDDMRGLEGDDVMIGGGGRDRVVFSQSPKDDAAGVTVDLRIRTAQDTGQGVDTIRGVEHLFGTRLSDSLTGDGKDNLLSGFGTGNDTLEGRDGADTLAGGRDNDRLTGGDGADLILPGGGGNVVDAGDGDDWILLDADADTLVDGGAGFDLVSWRLGFMLGSSAPLDVDLSQAGPQPTDDGSVTLTGVEAVTASEYDDTLAGTTGHNRLYGDAGADRIDGGGAGDLLYGDGYVGFDGRLGHAVFYGAADILSGGGGGDTLVGGVGADRLKGDGGADVFRYLDPGDSLQKHGVKPDLILDLESGDMIDLAAIDADRTTHGKQAFVLVADFSGSGGELRLVYDAAGDVTRIEGDRNGNGIGDFVILATGDHTGFTNFVL